MASDWRGFSRVAVVFALSTAGAAFGQASFTALGDLTGGVFASQARGVSADGATLVGGGVGASGFREATRWTGAGGFVPMSLGFGATPVAGYISLMYAGSANGLAACGENTYSPPPGGGPPPLPITQAVRWTLAGGLVDLGTLPGVTPGPAHTTSARGMSADGSVVVGYAADAGGVTRPWRWTSATGVVDITAGLWSGQARGVSPSGLVVVGYRSDVSNSEAFKWTAAGGRADLGLLAGYSSSAALDVTSDGRRACGTAYGSGSNLAIVWDAGRGWRSVASVLASAGVSTAGWTLQFANAMSEDGTVIVGYGVNPLGQTDAFRANVPLPCRADFNGVGGVTVQDIFDFLAAYFAGQASADINGAGGVTVQDIFDYLALYFVGCG